MGSKTAHITMLNNIPKAVVVSRDRLPTLRSKSIMATLKNKHWKETQSRYPNKDIYNQEYSWHIKSIPVTV